MRDRLLITGATGFLGRNLIPVLSGHDAEMLSLTIEQDSENKSGISWVHCDLFDAEAVERIMKEFKPTHLLHMAWGMVPSNYNLPSDFEWLTAGMSLIKLFARYGGRRVVVTGSGVEYDWSSAFCREGSTRESYQTLYGANKNILRKFSESFLAYHGIALAWPRLFFLYGPYENEQRLVPHIITSLLKGEEAVIRSGNLYRDYFYIKDVVHSLSQLVFSEITGLINIASGEPVKLGYIAELIGNMIGSTDLLEFQ
ncbi:MAG: NAD-dependent epimerase/dehydratase family protein, partial [Bacteroidota bacterium]